ncbi:MAG: transposase [Candidatus Omnitrophica bacterium]|nr:transposase [Candidatus Omnitrophota bacterium]MCK5494146.1 transposase [Candidatus Omnitrophota bacterium]
MLKKIAESFYGKPPSIINWFKKEISSAITKGINNQIKQLNWIE